MIYWVIDSGIASNEAIKCPKCGTLIQKDIKECPKCALKIQEKDLQRKDSKKAIECPNCKTMNAVGSVTCSSCGINFIDFIHKENPDMEVLHAAKKRKRK